MTVDEALTQEAAEGTRDEAGAEEL